MQRSSPARVTCALQRWKDSERSSPGWPERFKVVAAKVLGARGGVAAGGGPPADDAAVGRGDPAGAASVAAEAGRRHPRRGRAPAAAARRPRRIPGVPDRSDIAEAHALGGLAKREFREFHRQPERGIRRAPAREVQRSGDVRRSLPAARAAGRRPGPPSRESHVSGRARTPPHSPRGSTRTRPARTPRA